VPPGTLPAGMFEARFEKTVVDGGLPWASCWRVEQPMGGGSPFWSALTNSMSQDANRPV
jgi:hypothetical protein